MLVVDRLGNRLYFLSEKGIEEMQIHKLQELRIDYGDEVVSMSAYHDYILIVTKHGHLYKLVPEDWER